MDWESKKNKKTNNNNNNNNKNNDNNNEVFERSFSNEPKAHTTNN